MVGDLFWTLMDQDIHAQRRYSHYLIAAIIGTNILKHFSIDIQQLTHKNFVEIKEYFDAKRDDLYYDAELYLLKHLKRYFGEDTPENMDGRRIAAVFRRFDFVENVLKRLI